MLFVHSFMSFVFISPANLSFPLDRTFHDTGDFNLIKFPSVKCVNVEQKEPRRDVEQKRRGLIERWYGATLRDK